MDGVMEWTASWNGRRHGMDGVMEWIGIEWIGGHCVTMDTKPPRSAGATVEEDDKPSQAVHYNASNVRL